MLVAPFNNPFGKKNLPNSSNAASSASDEVNKWKPLWLR